MHLGFPDEGHMTTYYLDSSITQKEIEAVSEAMSKAEVLPENTRVGKKLPDGGYELLIASGILNPPAEDIDAPSPSFPIEGGKTVSLVFGDHKEEMSKIALEMKKAGHYVANSTEKAMVDAYAKSFGTGSLKAFKESQIQWVKDIGTFIDGNVIVLHNGF